MVVAAPALGALAAFAAMCFLVFLYYAYGYSLGAVLVALANFFRSIGFSLGWFGRISLGFIADGITAIDNSIRHALGSGIIATRGAGLYLWHYAAYALHELGDTIADLAETTERALTRALHTTIPAFVTNRLTWLSSHVAALEKAVAHLPARVERITVERVHTVTKTIVHAAATVAGTVSLPRILPLAREVSALQRWIRSHAKQLAEGLAAGALIAALARVGLGWARCSKVGKVGKNVCGINDQLLESLLADTLLIAGTVSLVEFAKGMQDVTAEVVGPIRTFWRAA